MLYEGENEIYFEQDFEACVEFWKDMWRAVTSEEWEVVDAEWNGRKLLEEGYDLDMVIDSLQEAKERIEFILEPIFEYGPRTNPTNRRGYQRKMNNLNENGLTEPSEYKIK